MKLPSGETWSVPIIAGAKDADQKGNVEILTPEKEHIATLVNVEIYPFDKSRYCERVFGTSDTRHPGVQRTMAMPDMLIG